MSTSFMGFGMLFLSLPILIGQWVGIMGLGRANRNGAWWCMFSGIGATTLGLIGSGILTGLLMSGLQTFSGTGMEYYLIPSGLSGLGSLLFAAGFAIHGQQASKVHQRNSELETIVAAQGEEISRHRAS